MHFKPGQINFMSIKDRIPAFEKLGIFLKQFRKPGNPNNFPDPWLEELNKVFFQPLETVIKSSYIHNPWFTEDNVRHALFSIGNSLNPEDLENWIGRYNIPDEPKEPKTVALVMAGNIPLVGFHDMLCVLLSGHNVLAKLSVKDEHLPKIMAEIIWFLDNDYEGKIRFEEGQIKNFDSVIATGSNNTSRYFEYYFGGYPNIIRKNRNSAAILDGNETTEELRRLSDDVFRYFGLGCRNVSKIFVPKDYDFISLIQSFSSYSHFADHHQWANNYEYQRAVHLIDQIPHIDTGFLIIREENALASPITVINYEKVGSTGEAFDLITRDSGNLQCVVGRPGLSDNIIPFGKSQEPNLNDYADNIDTMEFLLKL